MSDEPTIDKPEGELARKMRHVTRITGIEKWRADKFVEMFRRDCYRISVGRMELRVLLDLLAAQEQVSPELVPRLCEVVPPELRDQFASAFREAASPQFRLPIWVRGFPKTWEELETDADVRTGHLRAWAIEFCRCAGSSLPADRKMPNP
jgi:hypothetical protein